MLSPARPVTPPGPDGPRAPDPERPAPGRDTAARGARSVLVLGLVALLAALAFPFAPVSQPQVRYSWTAADGPAAIPLMPYQPAALEATTSCAAARGEGERVVLSTVPPRAHPAAEPLSGLLLTGESGRLRLTSAGVDLGGVALPVGDCAVALVSDPQRTTVLVDGAPVLVREGDVRPDVAGAFTDLGDGVALTLTADTRFQTTISPAKAVVGAVAVVALVAMLLALRRVDRAATAASTARPVRLLPRRWWRPRAVDAAVAVLLGVWWVVGAVTVDDGYIAGIVRSRGSNGFVGNVYRWLNAPEAPFSWIYDLSAAWSAASASTAWMRLPSVLLGLLCWGLLSRLVLPRLGRAATRRSVPWLAALAFGSWWVPFNLGLRPEPWVAVGTLAVFLAVERAVATRALLPLVVGLVLAGATVAVTPGGLMALAPLLAAVVPVLRLLRTRRDLPRSALLAALAAAPAAAVLLMVLDQSLAGLLEATRVRALIGGGVPWYQELERYGALLEAGSFQGAIGRRAPVLLALLAAVGVLVVRRSPGVAAGPARRLAVGFLVATGTLTASPTKWTQHFGALAGYGAAVLVLGAVVWSAGGLRDRPARLVAGLGATVGVVVLVMAGYNLWPYVGDWFTPPFSTLPPQVAGTPLATVALVVGGGLVLGLVLRSAWRRAGGSGATPVPRWVPGPVPPVACVLAAVLALQVLGQARIAVQHRDSYTPAADAVATLRGEPCGLQRLLSVETDPAAGLLPTAPGAAPTSPILPVDVGGATLPGVAVAGRTTTAWSTLAPEQRAGTLPAVVTTSGRLRPGDRLSVEFGAGGAVLDRLPVPVPDVEPRDARLPVPAGADAVRLVVDAPTAGPRSDAVVSLPRVPVLTPMAELLPPGTPAILDWPVAFLFPCLVPEPLALGTAGLAQWRVAPPASDPSAGITYAPAFGGPFAGPRLLVTERRMATYLRGDPLRDPGQLHRWTPLTPLTRPRPVVVDDVVSGWHSVGPARVPGLDRVG